MTSSSNGTEQSSQEEEVVTWLTGRVGQTHGPIHYLMEVGLERAGAWVFMVIKTGTKAADRSSTPVFKNELRGTGTQRSIFSEQRGIKIEH